ncbi:hypothetical protein ACFWPI_26355, partial [Kitasatospora sp. NPDC058492]
MTDQDDAGGRIIRFPRIGFGRPDRPATPAPADPAPAAVSDPPTGPAADDRWAGPIARAEMAAMAVGTGAPVSAGSTAPTSGNSAPTMPAPGFVPDTFLANPGGEVRPQEGAASLVALTMAAVVGIAVSTMRGIHSGIASLRGDGKEKGKDSKDSDESDKKKKKIQPAHEFGESATGKNSDKKSSRWNPFGSSDSGKKSGGGTSGSSGGSGGGKPGGAGADSGSGKKSDGKSGGNGAGGGGKP